ncbi:MAG: hypothetical protein ACKVWV_15625 [Planctomycetota bacterium]
MMPIQIRDLLTFLKSRDEDRLVSAVKRAVDRVFIESSFPDDRDTFLDARQARALFQKAIKGGVVSDCNALERLLRRLKIPATEFFHFHDRCAPWDEWRDRSVIAVVLGGKIVEGQRSPLQHRVVGSRDAEALASLERVLRGDAGIEFSLEVHPLYPDMSSAAVTKRFETLCARKDVGAVVVLGSEIVNPMTTLLARHMFDDVAADKLPARFRWSFDRKERETFLSNPKIYRRDQEGIALRGYVETTLPREHDETILKRAGKKKRGFFQDCGLLAMDFRSDKLFVLCAGHGGCGTRAAVLGLSRTDYIEDALLAPSADLRPFQGPRLFEPIWVKRRKPTPDPIDDLDFDDAYGTGWGFAFDTRDNEATAVEAAAPLAQRGASSRMGSGGGQRSSKVPMSRLRD